jgi:hypothetical protein
MRALLKYGSTVFAIIAGVAVLATVGQVWVW